MEKNPHEEADFTSGHTIFNNNKECGWNQRLTDSYGLVLTVSGKGSVSFGGSSVDSGRGDLLLLKPHWKHFFECDGNWDILWFHFLPRPHIPQALDWPESGVGTSLVHFDEEEYRTVHAALREAHDLEYHRPPGWSQLAYLLLESTVVRAYNHFVDNHSGDAIAWIPMAEKLLTETKEDMDTIAARCNVSRASLYNKFKKASGVSPRQYREYAMLRRAVPLLEKTDLPISEIAKQIGMSDQYYFSTRFSKYSGFSPRAYRRKSRGET